jgi:cell division protein FtsI (penicillin-binding protein 3)
MFTPGRTTLIHLSLLLFAAALVARAAQVQLWQGGTWAKRAQRQHWANADVPARRGAILDAAGAPLAENRELVRLSIAPREVRDAGRLSRELARSGVPRDWVRRASDRKRAWVRLPGRYLPSDVATLTAMRGVYSEPTIERVYTSRQATRRVIGRVDAEGRAMDGLELALDSLLRGTRGRGTVAREARGRSAETPMDTSLAPLAGDNLVLTINQELQEIAERALGDAVSRTGASGGDIVILDPHTGEVRAMSSRRSDPRSNGSSALVETFEPGSTLKPFLAAALLTRGLARTTDVVSTENGVYTTEGRTINDIHREASMSLAEVIRWSSNIGMVKFAQRLSRAEQYEALRDFGFGTPTGIEYPSEASGVLRVPKDWSRQSAASLAMGYEIGVTPIQLAVAFAAIANGGELLEPTLVKEVRSADGTVRYRHQRRVVRRTMPKEVADTILRLLVGVVQDGTARTAGLGQFAMAGKSGTARRSLPGKGYVAGAYTASFVGLFPADAPQYVVLVKLDDPVGDYYGGKTAAPVSKVVIEAAIAARHAALDRGALAARSNRRLPDELAAGSAGGAAGGTAKPTLAARELAVEEPPPVISLPSAARRPAGQPATKAVPDVLGMPVRQAVRALHLAGFRVRLTGLGSVTSSYPQAGQPARQGDLVRLVGGR